MAQKKLHFGVIIRCILNLHFTMGVVAVLFVVFSTLFFSTKTVDAAQTIPYKVNFQGRLTDASGANKPNGLYNMKLRLYSVTTGGTASWTETLEAGNRVQVTNGMFNVQLGNVTPLSPSNFTSYPQYLEVELPTPATANCSTAGCETWTEGAMTPRSPLGSSPYAFNADTVDGIDGINIAQTNVANSFTGSNTFYSTSSFNARAIFQSADANFTTNSFIAFNQYFNGSSYVLQDAGSGSQILNSVTSGLVINVTAPKASGANAVNNTALTIQAATDNVRATIDGGTTYGQNLISNPGYEFGCVGWDASSVCTADSANARSGLQAGKYTMATTTSSNYSNSRLAAVQPGDVMYAQGYVKSSAATTGQGGIGINFFDKNGTYLSNGGYSVVTNPGTTYALRTVQATVPANAVYASTVAVFFGDASATTGGSWYFDDMAMYASNVVAPTNYKNSVNSTSAFQIQDASSNTLFMADTTNNAILIGGGDVSPAANVTLFVLDNKTTSGDPTGRPGAMYYNASSGKFRCYEVTVWRNCADGLVYANTTVPAGNTYSNTVAENIFASNYVIPANDCRPGRVYQVKVNGVYGTGSGAPATTMRVKLGTTNIGVTSNTTTIGTQTNQLWSMDFTITCLTTGTSGTIEAQGEARRYSAGNAINVGPMPNAAPITIDTTVAQTLQFSETMATTASASNTITLRQLTVTAMGPS